MVLKIKRDLVGGYKNKDPVFYYYSRTAKSTYRIEKQ